MSWNHYILVFTASLLMNGFIVLFVKLMIEKYQLEPVVVFVKGVEIQLLLQLV